MKSTRQLRLRLRLIEGALLLLLGTLTAGAVATRQLLLDMSNHPTTDVSLSSPHWTGTLDAARLPASVPLFDDSEILTAPGGFSTSYGYVIDDGGVGDFSSLNVNGLITSYGPVNLASGNMLIDSGGDVSLSSLTVGGGSAGISGQGDIQGDSLSVYRTLSSDNGNYYTDGNGGLCAQSLTIAGATSTGDELFAAGATVVDADAYLWTAGQPYQTGTVTPTGFLTFKDATGVVYLVPAMVRP